MLLWIRRDLVQHGQKIYLHETDQSIGLQDLRKRQCVLGEQQAALRAGLDLPLVNSIFSQIPNHLGNQGNAEREGTLNLQ
jgi:hypothetical protein